MKLAITLGLLLILFMIMSCSIDWTSLPPNTYVYSKMDTLSTRAISEYTGEYEVLLKGDSILATAYNGSVVVVSGDNSPQNSNRITNLK